MEVGLAVGGAFLSSALNVFFDRMTPKFPHLFRGRKGTGLLLLRKLKTTLLAIHAVLDDAENKQISNRDVKQWLSEVKNTVFDAEDLVDEINAEALRLEVEAGEQSITDAVSHFSDEFLEGIIPKIEEVVTTLEYFVSQINVLGLERHYVIKQDASSRLPSTSLVDESEVCGRDNERDKLIHMVLSGNNGNGNNVSVIPIVGMGGLGKTTLAQLVYNHGRVEKEFDKRAWVCVSENYDAFKITQTLVEKVCDGGSGQRDDLDMLQVKLNKSLKDKKFFIVLDDVWNCNYDDWDKLKAPLKGGREGSVILVTTRDEDVAKRMQTQDFFPIRLMSDDDCWSLFQEHAFNNSRAPASPEIERIGREIVAKCKGLPLAVKTIGGLLRSTAEEEWDDILKNDIWNRGEATNGILPVLKLSYNHLPPHLKHCFAFCAVFPKNYTFDEEELVLLWMANDLLQQLHQDEKMVECMEDVGRKYFRQLRSRSLFQKKSGGGYIMHDLINDLARYVFGEFCVSLEDHQSHKISTGVRHVSYERLYVNAFEKLKFLSPARRLRTFFPTSFGMLESVQADKFVSDILPQLGRLRVLSLCNYYYVQEFPNSLGNLKHLRYLNFSMARIRQLPNAICGLHNLQTLILSYCFHLKELPKEFSKLVNLRHLDLKKTDLRKMPRHMSKLRSLQTLSYFIVDKYPGRKIEELRKLSLHGCLKINGLENITSCNDALKACLSDKNHLEDLALQWNRKIDDSQIGRDILDKLQPHTNLKSLKVIGYGGTSFPDWLVDCNIVSLHLIECYYCFKLPTLGHLAFLKELTIYGLQSVTSISKEFYGDGSLKRPFASLETLKVMEMYQLEEWDTPLYTDFSRLEKLIIRRCPNLKGNLPPGLVSLREFEISGCERLECFSDWVGVVQDNQVGSLSHHLSSLQRVSISDIPNLKELPEALLRLGLKYLNIVRCDGLVSFPKVMARVEERYLTNCSSFVPLPIMAPHTNIINCPKLEFPEGKNSGDVYSVVERLEVVGACFNNSALGLFPKLQSLCLERCKSLEVFLSLQNSTLLRELQIYNCNDLLSFPRGGLPAPNMQQLRLRDCKNLKSLPEQMHSLLASLRHLDIQNCPKIESFPEEGLPSSLESLKIDNCKKLVRNPIRDWGLQRLPALRHFMIYEFDEKSFPDEGLLPDSLRFLHIGGGKNLKALNEKVLLHLPCLDALLIRSGPNLESLPPKEGLPTSLRSLLIYSCPNLRSLPEKGLPTFLSRLCLVNCPTLQSLPEEGLPTSLSYLEVNDCPMLKPHLERERGKYWCIISHIPSIRIDRVCIS